MWSCFILCVLNFIFSVQPTQLSTIAWIGFLFYMCILLLFLIFIEPCLNDCICWFFMKPFIQKLRCVIYCGDISTFFWLVLLNLVFVLNLYIHNVRIYLIAVKPSMTGGTGLVTDCLDPSKSSLIIFPRKHFIHRFLVFVITAL